jgi:hypothetical protein
MRKAEPLGKPCRDRHRPVDPGRDDTVDGLRSSKAVEALFVLGRDDRPPVRVLEPGGERIAITGDHEKAALARGPQEPELRRSCA